MVNTFNPVPNTPISSPLLAPRSDEVILAALLQITPQELSRHYSSQSGYERLIRDFQFNPLAETDPRRIEANFESLRPFVEEASSQYKIDSSLIFAILLNESGGRAIATSPSGCKGVMQLSKYIYGPNSFSREWINPYSPRDAIDRGVHFLSVLHRDHNGDLDKMVAEYHGSKQVVMNAINQAGHQGGDWKEYLPPDTRRYIRDIRTILSLSNTRGIDPEYFPNGRIIHDTGRVPSASEWGDSHAPNRSWTTSQSILQRFPYAQKV